MNMTIGELLEMLDGAGLILIDEDLLNSELESIGANLDADIEVETEND